jgi:hypothetical protein
LNLNHKQRKTYAYSKASASKQEMGHLILKNESKIEVGQIINGQKDGGNKFNSRKYKKYVR